MCLLRLVHALDAQLVERRELIGLSACGEDMREHIVIDRELAQQTIDRANWASGRMDEIASFGARRETAAARNSVDALNKEIERITGVSGSERIGLTFGGALTGMGASYVGAGGTLLKGADSGIRLVTDADIMSNRGQVAAQQYNARQTSYRPHGDNSDHHAARAETRRLQKELSDLVTAKEAEALAAEDKSALLQAAVSLDAEYERLRRQSEQDIARAKLGRPAAERFLIDTAVTGTQVAADAAANAVVPGSSLALKGVRSFGDASQEARRNGATVGQQLAYGGAVAGLEMGTEKYIDGFAGTYGKGVRDSQAEHLLSDFISDISPKTASRLVDIFGEAAKPVVNYGLETPLMSIYNGNGLLDNYSMDGFSDALRDVAIQGITSGVVDAWSDAQNWALNKAYDTAMSPKTQAELRRSYAGSSVQPSAESYITLIKMLYNKKGDGHRW